MIFTPKVSIVIPVFNGKNYLREAIDSALAQTYSNLEVVVVNDGSSDDGATEEIAQSYGKKIRYFNKKNGGVSSALNLGIEKMEGEYFSWLSHDDTYFPDKIESQIKLLAEQENKETIIFGDYDLMNEHSKTFANVKVKDFPADKIKFELIQSSPIHGCTLLIAKSLFSKAGLFDEKLRTSQDYDLWFKMADYTNFLHLKKSLVRSRIHSEQGTQALTGIMTEESERMYQREIKKLFAEKNNYSSLELIKCANGLVKEYCFKSASMVLGYLSTKKMNPTAFKALISYSSDYLFHRALFIRRKLVPPKSKKKRVVIITPGFYPLPGGLAEHCFLLGKEFVKRGYEVDVLTEKLKSDLLGEELVAGINVFRLSHIKKRNIFGLSKLFFETVCFIMKRRSKYSFCVVRTISLYAVIIGFLKRIRAISYKTYASAESGGDYDEIKEIHEMSLSKMIVFFLKGNNFLNSNNDDNTKHYLEVGVPKEKISLVYNGIDISSYEKSSYPKEINDFIFLAELNPGKGIKELLEAFKMLLDKFSDKKLYIGGYGQMEGYIKDFIESNHLKGKIIFEGYITKENKRAFFEKGDCFVFPSYSEGFGLVTAEAIKYKRLLITTKVADLEKIYGNRVLYCNIKDVANLLDVMSKAIINYNVKKINYDEIISKIDVKTNADNLEKLLL
jgi:glycosyltransferase involved in cell wall biosynthesis